MATGWEATRLAAIAYLAPFFFVYSPELILKGHWADILLAVFTACVGCIALGSGLMGYLADRLGWSARILLLAAGLGLIKPGLYSDIFGAVVLVSVFLYQRGRKRMSAAVLQSK